MDEKAIRFVDRLSTLTPSPNDDPPLVDELKDAINLLEGSDNRQDVVPAVFEFFERFPDAELGTPGPLAHFVEEFFPGGYEDLLIESLHRRPTSHTSWLANRLLNSEKVAHPLRSNLLDALRGIASHPLARGSTKQVAEQFLEHQESRS